MGGRSFSRNLSILRLYNGRIIQGELLLAVRLQGGGLHFPFDSHMDPEDEDLQGIPVTISSSSPGFIAVCSLLADHRETIL